MSLGKYRLICELYKFRVLVYIIKHKNESIQLQNNKTCQDIYAWWVAAANSS